VLVVAFTWFPSGESNLPSPVNAEFGEQTPNGHSPNRSSDKGWRVVWCRGISGHFVSRSTGLRRFTLILRGVESALPFRSPHHLGGLVFVPKKFSVIVCFVAFPVFNARSPLPVLVKLTRILNRPKLYELVATVITDVGEIDRVP
jgi:hypothetical protein